MYSVVDKSGSLRRKVHFWQVPLLGASTAHIRLKSSQGAGEASSQAENGTDYTTWKVGIASKEDAGLPRPFRVSQAWQQVSLQASRLTA